MKFSIKDLVTFAEENFIFCAVLFILAFSKTNIKTMGFRLNHGLSTNRISR